MTRLTDAEGEAVVEVLRRHLLDDRITLDDYADRVGAIWAADGRESLDAVLADLPRLPPAAPVRVAGRRHGEGAVPDVTWRPTAERFRDPTTGRVMRVWVDVADGARHYVCDDEPG
ncbi:MAG TPA: DUF1707 domain-containing protein [Acidimicrobiales bacterium]|nr:DUF1707 domain-containing protein [Acidimicrobiales bacterium]